MADRYIFTPPNAIFPMVEDLRVVAEIDTENLQRLGELLTKQTGFLTDDRLVQLVGACVDDETQGTAVFNAVQNLSPSGYEQVLTMLRAWRESSEERRQQLPDDVFAALEQKLPVLIRDYPALNRIKKADRLRIAIGNEFERVVFICDARPVYNENRDCIEGLIPLTTMKLVYERQNSETEEIEIVLTSEQLKDLVSKAKKAEQKLTVLSQSIEEWMPQGCVYGVELEEADADET
jgi:hypothetical protein